MSSVSVLFLFLVILYLPCTTSKPTGFSLKIIPRDSPESPLYPGNLTEHERLERIIRFSEERGSFLDHLLNSNATIQLEDFAMPLFRDRFYYTVQVTIGTPETMLYLLLDTGSGLIWTQCAPCKNCYQQKSPIFNSLTSSTYRKLTCDHPLCSGDRAVFRCANDECVYTSRYSGGGSTQGTASLETFKFSVAGSTPTIIDGIIFGCSNDNQNVAFAKNGVVAGIIGISMSPESIISQFSISLKNRFSYCMVPFRQVMQGPSVLTFGDEIRQPSGRVQFTKFVTPPGRYHYFVDLEDISVGTIRMEFAPGKFAVREGFRGGTVIDSGTVVTRLDTQTPGLNAFTVVLAEFERYYDARGLEKVVPVREGLRLCYRYPSPGYNDFAPMTYHFADGDYLVEPQHVNFITNDYFCVGLSPGNGISVIGGLHQQNMRLIFDIDMGGLTYVPEVCNVST